MEFRRINPSPLTKQAYQQRPTTSTSAPNQNHYMSIHAPITDVYP